MAYWPSILHKKYFSAYARTMSKALSDYMNHRGLTQVELASQLGISQGQLNNWLSGKRKPSGKSLKKIAEKTRISLKRLVEEL